MLFNGRREPPIETTSPIAAPGTTAEKPENGLRGLKHWKHDLLAGLQVSLVSLPMSLGVAIEPVLNEHRFAYHLHGVDYPVLLELAGHFGREGAGDLPRDREGLPEVS